MIEIHRASTFGSAWVHKAIRFALQITFCSFGFPLFSYRVTFCCTLSLGVHHLPRVRTTQELSSNKQQAKNRYAICNNEAITGQL